MVYEFVTAHIGLLAELAGLLAIITVVIVATGVLISRFDRVPLEDAMYLAFITAFTVGFGDISPRSRGARVVCVALAFLGLILLGVLATVWRHVPGRDGLAAAPDAWLSAHIALSVATYGLCTLAAIAAAAAVLQERALKRKRPTALTRALPSVSDASLLEVRLLGVCEAVLALGIATGMARQFLSSGRLLVFDHKTLLAILAFAVIAVLLVLHRRSGLRGLRAARLILLAYLLLTLAYPGVKFVTDVLIG